MACITKKLRGYGFICQMLQLPIVVLQRTRWMRGKKTLHNVSFWCSMILGLSLVRSPVSCEVSHWLATEANTANHTDMLTLRIGMKVHAPGFPQQFRIDTQVRIH